MIWYLIILSLFADLSPAKAEDTVHSTMYSALMLVNQENILFAATPVSCSLSKGGNFIITCLILPQLLKPKFHYLLRLPVKSTSLVMIVALLWEKSWSLRW